VQPPTAHGAPHAFTAASFSRHSHSDHHFDRAVRELNDMRLDMDYAVPLTAVLILLPAVGLAVWIWLGMSRVEEELSLFSDASKAHRSQSLLD
jgi:hypothetical protein